MNFWGETTTGGVGEEGMEGGVRRATSKSRIFSPIQGRWEACLCNLVTKCEAMLMQNLQSRHQKQNAGVEAPPP